MRRHWGTVGRSVALPLAGGVVCAALFAKLLVACVDLDSLGNGRPDSSAPSADVPPLRPPDPCLRARPVGAPDIDDDKGTELPRFVLAVDQVTLDPGEVPGFDLDGLCTCDSRPGAALDGGGRCVSPDASATANNLTCDLDGGSDNVVARLAKEAASVTRVDRLPNGVVSKGRRSLLVQIGKYNGRANDSEVGVGAILADGIREQGCFDPDASTFQPDTNSWSPGRCGSDTWTVDQTSVIGNVAVAGGVGYVRDWQLVVPAFGQAAQMPFSEEGFVTVSGAILTGTIVPLGEDLAPRDPLRPPTGAEQRLFRIEGGVLAGRVTASDALSALGSYRPQGNAYLCTTGNFDFVKDQICNNADLTLLESADRTARCDSLSIAFGFVAIPSLMGKSVDAGPRFDGCAPADGAPLACP